MASNLKQKDAADLLPLAPRPSPLAPRLSPLASRPSPLTPCPSSFAPRPSPRLWINPDFQDLLQRLGLTEAAQFLDLPGLIVSGHPDRHVVRVYLGGPDGLEAYLKREHRVGWRHYLASAWAGFGWTSRSVREAQTLAALRQAGGACPEWIAAGEDGHGRAFLLLAGCPQAVDLRKFLGEDQRETASRRRFARNLGRSLAGIHQAGFVHVDLYAKHVLVNPFSQQIHLLDWQRSQRRSWTVWKHRVRDLASLEATLAEDLATPAERLLCVRAYLQAWGPTVPPPIWGKLLTAIRACATGLLSRHHVKKERGSPPPIASEGILWLDGEALCVTQEFWNLFQGQVPSWLPLPAPQPPGTHFSREWVSLPGDRQGLLIRRWSNRPWARLGSLLRFRLLRSPELRLAGVFFRRQKHGLRAPRVLAFGQRRQGFWKVGSFLLIEI